MASHVVGTQHLPPLHRACEEVIKQIGKDG